MVRPALLEPVRVEAYGQLVPLAHVATVTGASGARALLVVPFDSSLIGKICQAIQSASLGLNPQQAGTSLLVNVPRPDGEQRARLIARAKALAEQQRVAVRNVRKDARNKAKRDGRLERLEREIDQAARLAVEKIDGMLEAKVDEIEWKKNTLP